MTAYATLSDLNAYLGAEPPADSQRLLARAQEAVDAALRSSAYAVDTFGNPTDATVIAAVRDATVRQVEWWLANGDELNQQGQYSSFSIEGIAVTRSTTDAPTARLCGRARDALQLAGLLPGSVLT